MTQPLCISVRQPWAHLIIHAGKDIENRTWPTRYRGPVLIHAAKGMTANEYEEAMNWMVWRLPRLAEPKRDELLRGGIIGSVEIVDCVLDSDSPWFAGPWGFVLRNPKPLPFQPCRGALGFFRAETGQTATKSV